VLSGPVRVDAQLPIDSVADAPLERADRFFAAVAFGDLAVVVGAAEAVTMADLGDGGHVDGVVESTVAAPRQAEHLASPLSRGHLDRCGAVVGSEPIPAGKAADVGDVADDRGSDDRSDPEQASERRLGRLDGSGDPLFGVAQLVVEAAQVGDQLGSDGVSGCGNRTSRLELVEQTGGLSCADLTGEPAWC